MHTQQHTTKLAALVTNDTRDFTKLAPFPIKAQFALDGNISAKFYITYNNIIIHSTFPKEVESDIAI